MNELALFAGAGGGILGGHLLGWRTVCAVEIDPYCRKILLSRQKDGYLPHFPIWDDVQTFDGESWRGHVDVVSGGFPCQDISSAGKRQGLTGAQSGLWVHMARIIGQVQPAFCFIENSANLRTRGLDQVLFDLARLGYDAQWGVFGASAVGAPHIRKRMWIVAYANHNWQRNVSEHEEMATTCPPSESAWKNITDSNGSDVRLQSGGRTRQTPATKAAFSGGAHWWPMDLLEGVDDGVASRMDRIRATGNGQVAAVARLAWRELMSRKSD